MFKKRSPEDKSNTFELPSAINRNSRASKASTIASHSNRDARTSVERQRQLTIAYTDEDIQMSSETSSNTPHGVDVVDAVNTNELIGNLYTRVRAVSKFKRNLKTEDPSLRAGRSMPKMKNNTPVVLQLDDCGPSFKEIEEISHLRRAGSQRPRAENEEICRTLLQYARFEHPDIQLEAFREIVNQICFWPAVRSIFQAYLELPRNGDSIESVILSWRQRRNDASYSDAWRHFHEVVLLCLTANPLSDEMIRLEKEYPCGDISNYVQILARCAEGDERQKFLGLQFMQVVWTRTLSGYSVNIEHLASSDQKRRTLLKLASAVRSRFELIESIKFIVEDNSFDWLVTTFMQEMWDSLRRLDSKAVSFASIDDIQSRIWLEMYRIYLATQSSGWILTPCAHESHRNKWEDECWAQLSDAKYSELREILIRIPSRSIRRTQAGANNGTLPPLPPS
ncbi:hypothetical protein SCHPADRAFT_943111 [Schizopora paradoxa]|uniref:Uncharacterized protein n=1 Tax=Schizopora paradoxa TaxID=27342 RepID=A0A0H2RDZ9_9AGAM|nr:hypothetical protein SCHPADRAFT_943111 [Schizopora paradoxa]